ncbi:MAG: hypothetical protein QMD66_00015 [Actinomycetota bacterium]|nr:hypothetical protein [Actinomycetota bacterium]
MRKRFARKLFAVIFKENHLLPYARNSIDRNLGYLNGSIATTQEATPGIGGKSRAPKKVANKTDEKLEQLVVAVRKKLEQTKYAQIGTLAIAWELKKLGLEEIPKPWTVNRILSRHNLTKKKESYERSGKPYPEEVSIFQVNYRRRIF